ncbi:MAG TPA: indole-3-glycerol-phosphate synthase TrpC, partial [Chromatiales bacterium]|nr:indole-3-glycerol-phosphate synthase TrpC [Chromatiales bacterium]HEX22809.1 indole-3-glycerol-phosphate synthase TrpC [Chromatiales bacterium]
MSDTPDILKKIIARKREEIAEGLRSVSLTEMAERARTTAPCRGFVQSMRD